MKKIWFFVLILFGILALTAQIINHRDNLIDFEVYHKTASRMLNSAPIYKIEADGHYIFKYSPTSGMYFIPFALFTFDVAKYIYWFFLLFVFSIGLKTMYELLSTTQKTVKQAAINSVILLSFLVVFNHFFHELHLGQVNAILMVCFIGIIHAFHFKKDNTLAFLLAFTIFLKPFGLIFIPYLLVKKRFKALYKTILWAIPLALMPFFLYPSIDQFIDLYSDWISELIIELGAKQALLTEHNHTIFSVLARYSPIQYLLVTPTAEKIYQLVVLASLGLGFLWFIKKEQSEHKTILELSIIIGFIPLFAFTNDNAFIFELPLIMYFIYSFKSFKIIGKSLIIVAFLLIGINNYELMGKELTVVLSNWSIYTFGVLILLSLLVVRQFKKIQIG